MPHRAVSLLRELRLVQQCTIGLRHLADHWSYLPTNSPEARSIPLALSAILAILDARLSMLDRVVSGELDPYLFWCPANAAGKPLAVGDEPDIHLVEWTARDAVRKAREELRRAKARRRHEKRQAATPAPQGTDSPKVPNPDRSARRGRETR